MLNLASLMVSTKSIFFNAQDVQNKERGGPPERMFSLKEPSPTTIARLKIEIVCNVVMPLTPSAYKMCAKLRKEGL